MHVSTGSRLLLLAAALAGALALGPAEAHAQSTDFATCPTTLGTCSTTVTSCCKKPFAPTASAKALIIPLDRCHQRVANSGVESPAGSGPPRNADNTPNLGNGWCASPTTTGDGMFQAYGLVYRLMQKGIPVYWLVNPTKTPSAVVSYTNAANQEYVATDVDTWILSDSAAAPPGPSTGLTACPSGTCNQPVRQLNGSLVAQANTYPYKEFPLRGGVFVIAPEDRAAFDAFWKKTGIYAALGAKYSFPDVKMYEVDASARFAYQDFTPLTPPFSTIDGQAPVAVTINYTPPRIARLGSTSAVATSWLARANIDDKATNASCLTGAFVPADAVYCNVDEDDVQTGGLVTGGFTWAWIDKWSDNSPCGNVAERTMFDKLREFMTAVPGTRTAGHVFFMESAVEVAEKCPNRQILGVNNAGLGLAANNSSFNETATRPYIYRYPTNLFSQWGDVPMDFQSGAVSSWDYYGGGASGYQTAFNDPTTSSLRRLATREATGSATNPICSGHRATATCDVYAQSATADITDMATYARYQNNGLNGVVFYTGGNQIQNNTAHLRMVLNSLIATPFGTVPQTTPTTIEVSRSNPVIANLSNQDVLVQGTYEHVVPTPAVSTFSTAADLNTFRFPYLKGHLRATPTSGIGTNTAFDDQAPLFDAADANMIPAPSYAGCSAYFAGSCRTVFTFTDATTKAPVYFASANVATLGPLLASNLTATEWPTLIERILAGHESSPGTFIPKLGGVDRSTVAVIPSSLTAGVARPTMIYFGAADGMLHAVCGSVMGPCDQLGRELWAFVPPKLLADLRFNTARIDGSPRVVDMFGDFDQNGSREFRTILMFQTGTGEATSQAKVPAVYAMDITDPADPKVLWEHAMADATNRATHEVGRGLVVAAGRVVAGGTGKNLAFAQTNNLGTGGAGSVVTAINIETGATEWQTGKTGSTAVNSGYVYPAPRTSGNPGVPSTGIPGGAVGVDLQGNGSITHVVFGTLYGDLWVLDAATGVSPYANGPLFRFSTDFHPVGAPPAIYSNGAQLFAIAVTGGYADPHQSSWAGNASQYAVGVALSAPTSAAVLDENSGTQYVPFLYTFGAGERSYAQALIVGDQLLLTTDTADVNSAAYGTSGSNTGNVYRMTLGSTAATSVVVAGGASSVASSGNQLFASSGEASSKLADASGGAGVAVNTDNTPKVTRRLWLRTL